MAMTRTFVAILLPDAWRQYLAAVVQDLAPKTGGLSWVKSENLHLTARFLGDLDDAGVRRACDSVRSAAEGLEAPVAALGGLGAFPNLERPRVVWAGIEAGAERVQAVARAIEEGLRRDGFGRADKPFRAHITLARVRERATGLSAVRDAVLPPRPRPAALERVHVMKSDLHPSGSRYTALLEVRLRPPTSANPG